MKGNRPTTIAEYIQAAPAEGQPHLRQLYALLKKVAPDAQEAIKWGNPFFVESSARPYVDGVLLAIRKVSTLVGVHRGLDSVLDLRARARNGNSMKRVNRDALRSGIRP